MVGRNTGIRILDVILKNKIQQEMIISDIKYTPPLEISRITPNSHVHQFFKNAVYVMFI
jgi:hypothetical protein